MSLAEEMLANMSVSDDSASYLTGQEGHIVINESRIAIVPAELKTIAVTGDKDIETVTFDCVRYWDGNDLSTFAIYLNYVLPDKTVGTYIPEAITTSEGEDVFHFDWKIKNNITTKSGKISFAITAIKTKQNENGETVVDKQWSSLPNGDCSIALGLDISNIPDEEESTDIVAQMTAILEQINSNVDELISIHNDSVRLTREIVIRHGENRVSNGTVTLGNGWSGDMASGFTHASGAVAPVAINGMFSAGDWILVTLTNSNVQNPRQVFVSVGDQTVVDTYFGKATTTILLKCESGVLKITPASAYVGTITLDSVYCLSDTGEYSSSLNLDTYSEGEATAQNGFWNVLLGGDNSFKNAVAVTRTISIGSYSLDAIQYGSRLVAIGTYAMRQLVEGERNVAIGADSLYRTKKADDNVAIGMDSNGSSKNEAHKNVSIGNYSMTAAKEGTEENVSIGHYAGRYANKRNTYIGMRAGYLTNGNGNVAIGAYSMGGTKEHGGDNNTIIGSNTQTSDAVISGSTVIGRNACATKSNQVVLGGDNVTETWLKGELVVRATDGTLRQIVFNADGTIGWSSLE